MVLNLFKKEENEHPADVKMARAAILKKIKTELQKAEGGEGKNIVGIELFIAAPDNQKHVYEAAVYADDHGKLRDEIQKIADDYALGLPVSWALNTSYVDELPPEASPVKGAAVAMFIRTKENSIKKSATAYMVILNGEAEKKVYELNSGDRKVNIGRDSNVQVAGGFFRLNQIAFPGDSKNEVNKYISRQHAHIEWSNENGSFMLYADEGGVPPGNKVKVKTAANETLNKLSSIQVGHRLEEGDQVILGEGAVMVFSYKEPQGKKK